MIGAVKTLQRRAGPDERDDQGRQDAHRAPARAGGERGHRRQGEYDGGHEPRIQRFTESRRQELGRLQFRVDAG